MISSLRSPAVCLVSALFFLTFSETGCPFARADQPGEGGAVVPAAAGGPSQTESPEDAIAAKNRAKALAMIEERMKDLSGSLGHLPSVPAMDQGSVIQIPELGRTLRLPDSGQAGGGAHKSAQTRPVKSR